MGLLLSEGDLKRRSLIMENETGISNDYLPMDPKRLLERFHTALNARDLTNLLHLLQVDFERFYPAQPDEDSIGMEAVREKWEVFFNTYPDFRADILRQAIEGSTIWSEWKWKGESSDGRKIDQVGVIIFGVEEGLLAWSRSYMIDIS
jgi:limonene-1,2-epoxide hydrolase